MNLGRTLKTARVGKGMTLRQVEAATGISNGYLCQLEADAIKQPSPNHLHRLAAVYDLSYGSLMTAAGYVAVRQVSGTELQHTASTFLGLEDLTEEDTQKIQAYIDDLRHARRGKGSFDRTLVVDDTSSRSNAKNLKSMSNK